MAVTKIGLGATTVVAAATEAGSAPDANTDGYKLIRSPDGKPPLSRVRTLIGYTGAVTAAVIRLYTREPGGTAWYRGVSTTESGYPLTPANGDESRDWDVGENVEFTFVLESITPSGSTPTVAVKATGVSGNG